MHDADLFRRVCGCCVFSVVICCGIYPAVLWAIGQTLLPFQANGSIVQRTGRQGGRLAADRPAVHQGRILSAAAVGGLVRRTARPRRLWRRPTMLLRDRVATHARPDRQVHRAGRRQASRSRRISKPGSSRTSSGASRISSRNGPTRITPRAGLGHRRSDARRVCRCLGQEPTPTWSSSWIKNNPGTPQPKAADLAVVFFENFSKDHPGSFPSAVTQTEPAARPSPRSSRSRPAPTSSRSSSTCGGRIIPTADLHDVPGDMVTTSGSGLDPDITLENAEFQLDRVASTNGRRIPKQRPGASAQGNRGRSFRRTPFAPMGGSGGEKIVNVLEVNLELRKRYGAPPA